MTWSPFLLSVYVPISHNVVSIQGQNVMVVLRAHT